MDRAHGGGCGPPQPPAPPGPSDQCARCCRLERIDSLLKADKVFIGARFMIVIFHQQSLRQEKQMRFEVSCLCQ